MPSARAPRTSRSLSRIRASTCGFRARRRASDSGAASAAPDSGHPAMSQQLETTGRTARTHRKFSYSSAQYSPSNGQYSSSSPSVPSDFELGVDVAVQAPGAQVGDLDLQPLLAPHHGVDVDQPRLAEQPAQPLVQLAHACGGQPWAASPDAGRRAAELAHQPAGGPPPRRRRGRARRGGWATSETSISRLGRRGASSGSSTARGSSASDLLQQLRRLGRDARPVQVPLCDQRRPALRQRRSASRASTRSRSISRSRPPGRRSDRPA